MSPTGWSAARDRIHRTECSKLSLSKLNSEAYWKSWHAASSTKEERSDIHNSEEIFGTFKVRTAAWVTICGFKRVIGPNWGNNLKADSTSVDSKRTQRTACTTAVQNDCNIGTFRNLQFRQHWVKFFFADIGNGVSSVNRRTDRFNRNSSKWRSSS